MIGSHLPKGWAKTQTLIALSSGEPELYETLRAASEGLGVLAIAKDLGVHLGGGIVLNALNSYGFAIGFNCMNTTPFTPPPYALWAQNQPN